MSKDIFERIYIAGFGGQGVLKLGLTLIEAAMDEGREVVWTPAYGPETRGGSSFCTVIISSDKIGSPIVNEVETGIVLDQPSLDKYHDRIKSGGTMIYNSSLVALENKRDDINYYHLPANIIAEELGSEKILNMVVLGALLKLSPICASESIIKAISRAISERNKHLIPLNEKALIKGSEELIKD